MSRPMFWILDGHTPVPLGVADMLAWGEFMTDNDRKVARDTVEQPEHDPVTVSTVFLGIDHNYGGGGPPLLFESMVFGGPLDQEQYRYATWDDAMAGHRMLLDEAVLEGKVSAWEVRERLRQVAHKEATDRSDPA